MTTYPGAIDEFRTTQNLPGILYNEDDTTTVFAEDTNNHSSAIVAIETTLGVDPAGAFTTVDDRLSDIESDIATKQNSLGFTPENVANKSTTTTLGTSNTLYPTQGAVKSYVDDVRDTILRAVFQVGAIYTSTNQNTNPGIVLGFGTWVAFAPGRVLVSKAASGTFGTIGATGGAETHTLILSEIPSHTHPVPRVSGQSTSTLGHGSGNLWFYDGGSGTSQAGARGGGGAHNNLQPYIVVYMWERTA